MRKSYRKKRKVIPPSTPKIVLYELALLRKNSHPLVQGINMTDFYGVPYIKSKRIWKGTNKRLNAITNYFTERLNEKIIEKGIKQNGNLWFRIKDQTYVEFTRNFDLKEDIYPEIVCHLNGVSQFERLRKIANVFGSINISSKGQLITYKQRKDCSLGRIFDNSKMYWGI